MNNQNEGKAAKLTIRTGGSTYHFGKPVGAMGPFRLEVPCPKPLSPGTSSYVLSSPGVWDAVSLMCCHCRSKMSLPKASASKEDNRCVRKITGNC